MSEVVRPRPKPTARGSKPSWTPSLSFSGFDEAVSFLMHFGGAELHLPKNPKGRSHAAALFGAQAVAKLGQPTAASLGRRVPLAKPWLARVYAQAAATPPPASPAPCAPLT